MIRTLNSPEAGAATQEQRQFRAFVKDDATRQVVDQVVGELAIASASVHKGGIAEATRMLGEQRSPRLLVVDISGVELPLSAVNELAEVCEPGVTVIAIAIATTTTGVNSVTGDQTSKGEQAVIARIGSDAKTSCTSDNVCSSSSDG